MSDRAKAFAWASALPPTERFILLALADHADQDGGHIDTSLPTIAAKTGYALRTVQRIVQKLLDRGVLELLDWRPPAASLYQINLAWTMDTPTHDQGTTHDQGDRVSPRPTITLTEDHPDRVSPASSDRTPKPQTQRPSRARVLTSSSVRINSVNSSKEEEGGRAKKSAEVVDALKALGVNTPQAQQALVANPQLTLDDVAAWRTWLTEVNDDAPMSIMIARLKRGEPVPVIYGKKKSPPAPVAPPTAERRVGRLVAAPSMVIPISAEELEENRRIMATYGIFEEVRHVPHLTR